MRNSAIPQPTAAGGHVADAPFGLAGRFRICSIAMAPDETKNRRAEPAVLRSWEDIVVPEEVPVFQYSANGLAGNVADILAGDAEVGEFAIGHAAEFGNGLAVLDPIVVSACDVHFISLSSRLRSG